MGTIFILYYLIVFESKKFDGQVLFIFCFSYAAGRFTIEFFRGDAIRGIYGQFSTSQWISILIFILSLFGYNSFMKRNSDIKAI